MKITTVNQMREIEAYAIDKLGIPSIVLMESAAIAVAKHCMEYVKSIKKPKVVVVAGGGNNGGDGFAAARHLHNHNVDVGMIVVGNMGSIQGDALINLEIVRRLGLPIEAVPSGDNMLDIPYTIETCDLVLDALFGIGLNSPLEGSYEYIVEMINNYAKHVISIDMPSGINADTGQVMGLAVYAQKTVTFTFPKMGLMLYPGAEYAGEVVTENIGIPELVTKSVDLETDMLVDEEISALLPVRAPRTNKGSYGKTFVLAGSGEMPGAAVLACSAVYKVGGGLTVAGVTKSVAEVIHVGVKEVITRILPERNGFLCRRSYEEIAHELPAANVIVIGPGLGRDPHVIDFVMEVISQATVPLILDADALYAVAEEPEVLKSLKVPCIITPHPGEMSRLTKHSIEGTVNNIVREAAAFAREYDVITVLKDARTVVAGPGGQIYINVSGNSAMAKAGIGDVLTGVIAGFISQGVEPYTAAMIGTYIHGKAGDMAVKQKSRYGVTASDLIDYLPVALNEY